MSVSLCNTALRTAARGCHGPTCECVGDTERMLHKLRCAQPTVRTLFLNKPQHFLKPCGSTPPVPDFSVIGWHKVGYVRRQELQTFRLDRDHSGRAFRNDVKVW